MKSTHITSGTSSYGCLKVALEGIAEATLLNLNEYLTIGPTYAIDTELGREARIAYFRSIFQMIHLEELEESLERDIALPILQSLADSEEVLTIWYSDDTNEQMILRVLCYTIPHDRIHTIHVNTLLESEYQIRAVAQLSPDTLTTLLPYAQPISIAQHQQYAKEWAEILQSSSSLHIYEQGKIKSLPEEYYDHLILQACNDQFQNASAIIGRLMGSLDENIGDAFIDYRVRTLAQQGALEIKDNSKSMIKMYIRIPS